MKKYILLSIVLIPFAVFCDCFVVTSMPNTVIHELEHGGPTIKDVRLGASTDSKTEYIIVYTKKGKS